MRAGDDRRRAISGLAAVALPAVVILSLLPASAALADDATSISFATSTQTVAFGGDWYETMTVAAPYDELDAQDGTVDVYADGSTTPFVGGIALFRGGTAYVTPDVRKAPLGAGVHSLTAIYRPAAGSGLTSSQTATPLVITVTPLGLTATARLAQDASTPTVDLALSGDFVDALSTPAGEWTVLVEDSGQHTLFSGRARQPANDATPIEMPLGQSLTPGTRVTISATFSSSVASSGGTITQPPPVTLQIPAPTPAQALSAPVPWWSLIVVGILLLLAAAALIVQLARRHRPAPAAESS